MLKWMKWITETARLLRALRRQAPRAPRSYALLPGRRYRLREPLTMGMLVQYNRLAIRSAAVPQREKEKVCEAWRWDKSLIRDDLSQAEHLAAIARLLFVDCGVTGAEPDLNLDALNAANAYFLLRAKGYDEEQLYAETAPMLRQTVQALRGATQNVAR